MTLATGNGTSDQVHVATLRPMADGYVPQEIEPRWQERWLAERTYEIEVRSGRE